MAEARQTARFGNVPVGAVLLQGDEIIASAANLRDSLQDPTAHAELLALKQASQRLGSWRMEDLEMVVTLEPCAMCAGALVQSRIRRVYYATPEPKMGAHCSVHRLFDGTATEATQLPEWQEVGAKVLAEFFGALRARR